MNNQEFDHLLDSFTGDPEHDAALVRAHPVTNTWQLDQLLSLCDSPDEAEVVIAANLRLAEAVAASRDAYRRLIEGDPDVEAAFAAVQSAPDQVTAEYVLASVAPEAYEDIARRLAWSRMSVGDVQLAYVAMIESEVA